MIEAGDINDSQILSATVQSTDPRGLIKYTYTLPSGRLLCSEWIAPDNAKLALRKWVEVVREQHVEDASAQRRAKVKPSTPATTGTGPSSASTTPNSGTAAAMDRVLQRAKQLDNPDPLVFAQQRVDALNERVYALDKEVEQKTSELAKARQELGRWKKVIDSLEEYG